MIERVKDEHSEDVVIIGAGPSGLTAAYELNKRGLHPVLFEKLDKVGGIARTECYKGYHFDMGGHRFFTKSKYVWDFWNEVMGDDFLVRPRLSRIFYDGKFFQYPLKPFNALKNLGFTQSVLIMLSYIKWQLFPYKEEETFEEWVTNRFGKRLFETFFKSYTEKVWGISTSELKAEWAAQRIKDLSLKSALLNMFFKPKNTITTLIEEFHYPPQGPGMMWREVQNRVENHGSQVHLKSEVVKVKHNGSSIQSVLVSQNGTEKWVEAERFISSMPVTELIKRLEPAPPENVLEAADQLNYRDFLIVCLIVEKEQVFPDNWIYIHDPKVKVGRIQNFKNWSMDMVPDRSMTSLGMEYFCNVGDEIWEMADEDLIELARREIDHIGLAQYEDVVDGVVFRVPKSYPVYDSEYRGHLARLREYLDTFENFETVGRNGLHRYNNQDHAMLTGMLAVKNLLDDQQNNLWMVNAEEEYHEIISDELDIPFDDVESVWDAVAHVFPRLDPSAFGIAAGLAAGLGLWLATIVLVLKGGLEVGPRLGLLNQFFPGYSVTPIGSFIGLGYGFLSGFIGGFGIAFMRNSIMFLYMVAVERRAEFQYLRRIWDYI